MRLDEIPRERLQPFLEQERRAGVIWRRRFQTEALASAAAAPGVFEVLEQETLSGALDRAWLARLLATQPASVLAGLAGRRLEEIAVGGNCTPLGALLIERVAEMAAVPKTLAEAAVGVLSAPTVRINDRHLVAVLRLIVGLDRGRVLAIFSRHWPELRGLTDARARDELFRLFTEAIGSRLSPTDLVDRDGRPRADWLLLGRWGRRLLAARGLATALAPESLAFFVRGRNDPALLRNTVYPLLDGAMRRDSIRTIDALISAGVWRLWRLRAQPAAAARPALALRWLMAPAHGALRVGLAKGLPVHWLPGSERPLRGRYDTATLETWEQAMADLGEGLSGDLMARLCAPDTHWPPIYPFLERQALDLARRVADLGALAILAEDLACSRLQAFCLSLGQLVAVSSFGEGIKAADLCWLCRGESLRRRRSSPPGLTESKLLCDYAGVRIAEALQARVAAVVGVLERDPGAAIAAAASPPLWADRHFRRHLGRRLARAGDVDLAACGRELESALVGARLSLSGVDSGPCSGLARRLSRLGFPRASRLLHEVDGQ